MRECSIHRLPLVKDKLITSEGKVYEFFRCPSPSCTYIRPNKWQRRLVPTYVKTVYLNDLPLCDICTGRWLSARINLTNKTEARYDCPTNFGPWAFLCERHFKSAGLSGGFRLEKTENKPQV